MAPCKTGITRCSNALKGKITLKEDNKALKKGIIKILENVQGSIQM